jgi:quercetin dioxygenase-like cupin family protein
VNIVKFDRRRPITEFGSREATVAGIARCSGRTHVVSIELEPGGLVGAHKAVGPQLFLVVAGDGWVRANGERVPVRAGDAIYWDDGEWHETGSHAGLSAVVVEAERIEPV